MCRGGLCAVTAGARTGLTGESDDEGSCGSLLVFLPVGAVLGLVGRTLLSLSGDFRGPRDLEVSFAVLGRSAVSWRFFFCTEEERSGMT